MAAVGRVVARTLLFATLACACAASLPCPPSTTCATPGPRCRYIEGADACSNVPQRFTCACEGRVIDVDPSYAQPVCGAVLTWCVGRVVRYERVASFSERGGQ